MMGNVSCILKIICFQVEIVLKGSFRIEKSSTKNKTHRHFLEA